MFSGIVTMVMAGGLMLTGAVTIIAKLLEIGAKSAQAASGKTDSQDN